MRVEHPTSLFTCGFSAVVCCHLLGTSSTTEPQLAVLELGLCRDQPWGHHPPQKPSPALAKEPAGSQHPHFACPPLTQVLQLRRAGPPRQGVQAPSAAQEVPLLPEHQPHGGQLPRQSTAVAQLAGQARLLPRGGGPAQPSAAPREPGMTRGSRRGLPPG